MCLWCSQDECVCYHIQYRDNNGKNERRTAYAYQKGKLYGQYRFYCIGTAECPQQELLYESDSDGSVSEKTSCGDCGVATKEEYVEILEFTHFVEFFSFKKIGENHKEKSLVKKVTVVVALDLGTGNTKNSEYENE